MATRTQNERRFTNWQDLVEGGRRYWVDSPAQTGGWARIVKLVDADEITVAVIQEIYDRSGKLLAIHEKYPVDKGHRWL